MRSEYATYDGQTLTFDTEVKVKTPQKVQVIFLEEPDGRADAENLESKFERLFEAWYAETAMLSDSRLFSNSNFRQIVGLGKPAIPLILKKMQEKDSFIFEAITEITDEDPIPDAHAGKFQLIVNDWFQWGKKNNYIQ